MYDYGPFNLTIAAAGYQVMELENITITEPVDWPVGLIVPSVGGGSSWNFIIVIAVILGILALGIMLTGRRRW